MSDLIQRLRWKCEHDIAEPCRICQKQREEAADELTRLRSELEAAMRVVTAAERAAIYWQQLQSNPQWLVPLDNALAALVQELRDRTRRNPAGHSGTTDATRQHPPVAVDVDTARPDE